VLTSDLAHGIDCPDSGCLGFPQFLQTGTDVMIQHNLPLLLLHFQFAIR